MKTEWIFYSKKCKSLCVCVHGDRDDALGIEVAALHAMSAGGWLCLLLLFGQRTFRLVPAGPTGRLSWTVTRFSIFLLGGETEEFHGG